MNPLKKQWLDIVKLVVNKMNLMIRMNTKRRQIELKPSKDLKDVLNMQRTYDFLKAFMYGFSLNDSLAFLRLDDLYVESF